MSQQDGQRHLIVLSSSDESKNSFEYCQNYALAYTETLDCLDLNDPKKANDYLGQEFDAVIFNTFTKFDSNALGAIVGTIRAGGYLLIIKPDKWSEKSLFLSRFQTLLTASENTKFIDISATDPVPLTLPTKSKIDSLYASDDQMLAVQAVKKVVSGHRRRPLVITADRGRGKSASLGIASAQLCKEGIINIAVCAPSKRTAEVIFASAKKVYSETKIQFYSPDELHQKKPIVDLLLIDEAGTIPLTSLEDFLKHYSRIVFATTLHGYEGSGRGFTLKFFKILDKLAPDWKHVELNKPIRYPENDPLEIFIFKSLLLKSESTELEEFNETPLENGLVQVIEQQELINDELLLQEVFGLLVNAHYQTKPSDLMRLLDDDSMRIESLVNSEKKVSSVALVMQEGNLDEALATNVYQGERRINGHLVAQALAANIGIEKAPCLKGERISRIAVHPNLQGNGIGSFLLAELVSKSNADYVSTSFGATEQLIHFWKLAGFIPVYLGMKRDASSGAHSVIMIKGVSEEGKKLQNIARSRFVKHFPHLLSDNFKYLETDIIISLIANFGDEKPFNIRDEEKEEATAFAHHSRGYENTLYPIWMLACNSLHSDITRLTANERSTLISKVLQKHSWNEAVKRSKMTGKKEAISTLRQAVSKLIADI